VGAWDLERKRKKGGKTGENHDKGEEAIGDVLGSPFLDLGPLNESEVTLGSHALGPLSLTQILDSPEAASAEEIERVVTHMYTVGFDRPIASQ